MSRHVRWPVKTRGRRVGALWVITPAVRRVTRGHPGRGGRSFELSASAAPAALSSSLEVGCLGGGAEPLAPLPPRPVFSQHLAAGAGD